MRPGVTRRSLLAAALAATIATGSASAAWRDDIGTFRIGMLDAEAQKLSPGEMERIRAAYADALKMQTEIYRARDLPALVDALISGRVDYAMLTAAAYASAALTCACVEPLAKPVSADGSDGSRAVLFLAEGLSIADAARSKGIAIPGKDSFNAYGAALASLHAVLPDFAPGAKFIFDENNLDGAIAAYVSGKVDGFILPVPSNRTFANELLPGDAATLALNGARKVKAVWRSDPIANGPHAVRQNLPGEAKLALSAFLENLVTQDPDLNDMLLTEGAVSFRRAKSTDYLTAINAAKALAATVGKPAP